MCVCVKIWGWASLTFLGKLAYAWLTILSCYSSIPVLCSNWEEWWFEHCVVVAVLLVSRGR